MSFGELGRQGRQVFSVVHGLPNERKRIDFDEIGDQILQLEIS